MAACSTCYVSCGCNRTPFSADWGQNNLICYGSCRSVAIYQPEGWTSQPSSVISTLAGHEDRVNCVHWIGNPDSSAEHELVSGSVDKTVRVWTDDGQKFSETATLKGHTGSVNAVTTVKCCPNVCDNDTATVYIASASVDSTVRIWRREPGTDFEDIQTLRYGSGFVLTVAFILIPHTNIPILVCGADDCKIHLYVLQDGKFEHKMVLSGHEDWVRGLEFVTDDSGDLLLASCSQDHSIRIWRLAPRNCDTGQSTISVQSLSLEEDIKMKENTFSFTDQGTDGYFAVSLESVLSGHENWVYSVRWQSRQMKGDAWHQPMTLLSASMDKTLILWQYDTPTGVWIERVRVGEVGGNTLGFYGGLMSPEGQSILAHGYHGALHQWTYNKSEDIWEPTVTGGGHFSSVQDMEWDRDGDFLVSVSDDQTARIHTTWVTHGRETCWYELARPQIHGYDLQCLSMIDRYRFATGADEKVVRVFQAPRNFIENFCQICGIPLSKELQSESASSLPEGASIPALGLSNKAVFKGDDNPTEDTNPQVHPFKQCPDIYFKPMSFKAPPSEENLLQNTLWPETQKLYRHGYEIFALACNPQHTVLASACKAAKAEYANVILWDTTSWKQICSLEGATLTVTQMAFSHDGKFLLTVSRDRTWTLFRKHGDSWVKASGVDKKTTPHSRIIWACSWTHDDLYFLTVSRDKKAMLWSTSNVSSSGDGSPPKPVSSLDLTSAVTAVDVAPCLVREKYLVALGLETGQIVLYSWCQQDAVWNCYIKLSHTMAHHLAVKRLRFRPKTGKAGISESQTSSANWLQLASCGLDYAVKVFDIDMNKL